MKCDVGLLHEAQDNSIDCGNKSTLQESCVIAKMTAQCALYTGALKIFGTP